MKFSAFHLIQQSLINTLLQQGVPQPIAPFNRFSGFSQRHLTLFEGS
jgi:hypothetical protein